MVERMFPFITHTTNPIAGGPCPYGCSYCWATALKNRHQWEKYQGNYRLERKELKSYPPDSYVFVQDMGDIGDPKIPRECIMMIFGSIVIQPKVNFLLLTKNPSFYTKWWSRIPENAILGATIETDRKISPDISKAPDTDTRLTKMAELEDLANNRRFICVEPIMEFSPSFADRIINIKPWAVAVGYDNYNNHLPEPSFTETRELIQKLRDKGITVWEKTIREAWK